MVEIASSGNIALAHGFLTYGLAASQNSDLTLFGAGYPITPVNDIAEWGTRELPEHGGDFIQAESELAAINMVLGAASVGVPAFTVTSSPGISLMQEALSYAIGMEVPMVVANVVRGGPGLGNILGAQSDLNLALSGGHGDQAPIIFAPASCQEMYDHGYLAFEYSNRYRIPAYVLTDGYVGQLKEKFLVKQTINPLLQKELDRRELRSSIYVREGILHAHNWRLQRQFDRVTQDESLKNLSLSSYKTENELGEAADILIISYGIFSRIGFGVVRRAQSQGLSVGQVSLKVLSPFPEEALRQLAQKHKALYVMEGSCGQLKQLVRGAVGQIPLIGETLFPGGGLPDEKDVVENLAELSQKITPDYLKWKQEAQGLGRPNLFHTKLPHTSPGKCLFPGS